MTTIDQSATPVTAPDTAQEEPLPWHADEVYVSFRDGPAYTSRVSRLQDDLVRVGRGAMKIPVGTPAQMQWTQNGRGGFADGVVVAIPEGEQPGLYMRIELSVAGVERRFGVRTAVRVPVEITDATGRVLQGRTADLSLGGARVVVAVEEAGEQTSADAPFVVGEHVSAVLILGEGNVRLGALVAGVGTEPGDVRLQFLDPNGSDLGELCEFLHLAAAPTGGVDPAM